MSTPLIPPPYVPAPAPPSYPQLLPETNTPQANGENTPYSDKQLTDLEMRKKFPDLWRTARAQSKQWKEEARRDAAASLADTPKMVQQPRESKDSIEWVDFALPLFDPRVQEKLARATENGQQVWPPANCGDRYFSEYRQHMESISSLSYQLVGGGDPNATCIAQLPEFIICSDDQLESTFYDPFNWPRQVLDYRNISALWDEEGVKGSCAMFWKIACPEPATTPEGINRQIDETLQKDSGTRTYLNQTQLHDYLDWRKANGTAKDFKYILVRDKPAAAIPAPGDAGVAPSDDASNGNGSSGSVLGFFIAFTAGLTGLAVVGAIYVGQRLRRTPGPGTVQTVATAVPWGPPATAAASPATATATVPTTSPSSMASASTTLSHTGGSPQASPQPSPSATASTPPNAVPPSSSDSDDASVIGVSAVMLDIPPAGQEDDA